MEQGIKTIEMQNNAKCNERKRVIKTRQQEIQQTTTIIIIKRGERERERERKLFVCPPNHYVHLAAKHSISVRRLSYPSRRSRQYVECKRKECYTGFRHRDIKLLLDVSKASTIIISQTCSHKGFSILGISLIFAQICTNIEEAILLFLLFR